MLVIAVQTAGMDGDKVPWTGRRHDDDSTESTGAPSAQGLFDAIFHALHDGEQVAIGFDCELSLPAGDDAADSDALLARARGVEAGQGVTELRHLVQELGRWRPWTIVTTSLPRWRATTSILLWEAVSGSGAASSPLDAIEAFFDTVRAGDQQDVGEPAQPVVNLAAAAALDSEVSTDPAELTRPLLRVPVGAKATAR